ncbi:MAG: methyltransferase domain-containing protein [Rhodospirillales bacterium]|nr:methyltransferase domain-containing protein [Rhodospirillales bacterium]
MDTDASRKHTDDRLLGGRVKLWQPSLGYRAAIDPVLLAAALPLRPGQTALELGLGSGAAALCLLARVPEGRVLGVERDPALARLAKRNAKRNGLGERLAVVLGDVGDPSLLKDHPPFDHAFANPPYLDPSRHDPPRGDQKRRAHLEGEADLARWIGTAYRRLKPRGTLTLIHRADRMDALLAALDKGWGGVTVFPLWPKTDVPAKRLILRATKGSRAALSLQPGMVLHDSQGSSDAAQAILRDGAALVF